MTHESPAGPARKHRSRAFWSLVLLAVCLWPVTGAANGSIPPPAAVRLDAGRLDWSAVTLRGSKLLVPVAADLELRPLAAAELAAALIQPRRGRPVPARGTVLLLDYHSRSLGKDLRIRLWFRGGDLAVLQRSRLERTPGQERYKVYRYTAEGIYVTRRKPGPGEAKRPPERWTQVSDEFIAYPPGIPGDQVVSDPAVLFYVAAVADFREPGEEIRLLSYFDDEMQVVTLRYEGDETVRADFRMQGPRGETTVEGHRRALRLGLTSVPLDRHDGRDEVAIASLRQPRLLVDRRWRLPLELRGRIKVVGRVEVRLDQVVMRAP